VDLDFDMDVVVDMDIDNSVRRNLWQACHLLDRVRSCVVHVHVEVHVQVHDQDRIFWCFATETN
jgi:hypothetical protein